MRYLVKIAFCAMAMFGLAATGPDDYPHATPMQIDYPSYFGNRITIPANNPTTAEGVFLGRMLFYETALSAGNNTSCGTCHQQQLAFTDGKRFSAGSDGSLQTRNTMSLANLLWVRHFFWDGRAEGLETQAEIPLTAAHEMGQPLEISAKKLAAKKIYAARFASAFSNDSITPSRILKALSQFERTLISAGSRYDAYLRGEYTPTSSELNGITLFYSNPNPADSTRGAACGRCHGGSKTYSELFHNNGLDSLPKDAGRETITHQSFDWGRFRVATLRNIALTAPYMHDGRFNTLDEVMAHYNEHVVQNDLLSPVLQNNSNTAKGQSLDLTATEKQDVIAFLHMLTDSTFITDQRFSNPFVNN